MMVMPLGPDFAAGLGIPPRTRPHRRRYTAAAARRRARSAPPSSTASTGARALGVAMLGLVARRPPRAGFATGFAHDDRRPRALAGAFGGPATALALAIVADAVPARAARQGAGRGDGRLLRGLGARRAGGAGAGAARRLADARSSRSPALGLVVAGAARSALMPPLRGHLRGRARRRPPPRVSLARSPAALLALAATATSMASGFAIIPNIAAYVQFNLGYPRERLGLPLHGGRRRRLLHAAPRRPDGRSLRRPRVAALGTAIRRGHGRRFGWPPAGVPVIPLFVGFMVGNSTRNVSVSALSTASRPRRSARASSRRSRPCSTSPRPPGPPSPRSCSRSSPTAGSAGCAGWSSSDSPSRSRSPSCSPPSRAASPRTGASTARREVCFPPRWGRRQPDEPT